MSNSSAKRIKSEKVGIVGSGLIGKSWAMLFASAGYRVVMYDVVPTQLEKALASIRDQLLNLEKEKLLHGNLSADAQQKLITTTDDLSVAVKDSFHIQECVPENVDLKKKVFGEISELCSDDKVVLSSSTSCILPSKIFTGLPRVSQCIIAHPCNPPYHCPLIEIIPHSNTHPSVVSMTKELMVEIGQTPVNLTREIDGFAANRLQYAVINEAWRLVEDGLMSPEDVDKIFTSGLGMRYAFIGPFETIHLNAEGIKSYMDRYSSSIKRVSSTFGPIPAYDGKTLEDINNRMSSQVAANEEELTERRRQRDIRLAALSKLKKELNAKLAKSNQ